MSQSAQSLQRLLTTRSLERKSQILKAACQVFARRGFIGTHIREICKLSGVNIASVCYHFRDKRGLYEAVKAEAREQLSRKPNCHSAITNDFTPERQVQAIIESLCARLSGDSAWIARLAVWELVDETSGAKGTVGEGFLGDLSLLEAAIREAIGPEADANAVRLNALDVLSLCVLHCAAKSIRTRLSPKPHRCGATAEGLARHLAVLSLRDLGSGTNSPRTRQEAGSTARSRPPPERVDEDPGCGS